MKIVPESRALFAPTPSCILLPLELALRHLRAGSRWLFGLAVVFGLAAVAPHVSAAPPEKFALEDVLTGLEQPMSLRFLPDGRMLVIQKKGIIRIVDTSTTPATAEVYMNLASASHPHGIKADQERGLLDIAIDPNFPSQPYIYLFYTPNTGPNGQRARIARFTHQQNSGGLTSRGNPGSEVILWEDTHGYDSCCHFGGGLDFGPDGKLWLTVGDHFQGSYAASLTHAGGGVIRINKDGSIPADNPFNDGSGPNHDAIFAYGMRNPFRARWDLPTGRLFIGEVGGNEQPKAWEDLHLIEYDQATGRFIDDDFGTASDDGKFSGINFGWPTVEGLPPYTDFPAAEIDAVGEPIFAYRHAGSEAAINGGVIYRGTMFPAHFQGAYFYADSTRDFVRYLRFNVDGSIIPNPNPHPISIKNPDSISHPFDLTPLGRIVALEVGPDGALYYVSFTDQGGAYGVPNPTTLGAVRRYVYDAGNARPQITTFTAEPLQGPNPLPVEFRFVAADPEGNPMTYVLDFGDGTTSGAPKPLLADTLTVVTHTYTVDGRKQATLTVSDGTTESVQTITVEVGQPPAITSLTAANSRPGASGTSFRYGDTITFSATATDPEDGALTGANFTWAVSFVRPGNVHPALAGETDTTSILFPIPAQGQGFSGPVFYRASLTVTDSSGLSSTATIDIFPEKSDITFNTVPSGIVVQVDGNTEKAAPYVLDTLINFDHTISVPEMVCVGGTQYRFASWSNGATTAQQTFTVPPSNITLTATYTAEGACASPPTDGLVFHLKPDKGVVVSNSNVSVWEDQSSLANHLSAVGTPKFVPGTASQPGYVHFDGVDDALARTGFSGMPTGNGARTVILYSRYNAANTSGGGWAGFAYGSPSSNQVFGLALTPGGTLGVQGWGTGNDITASPATVVTGQWVRHAATFNGGTLNQFVNGTPAGSASRTYATGTSRIRLGEEINGGKNLNMDVAEVLVYNRVLTQSELATVDAYLGNKYNGSPGGGGTPPTVGITSPAAGAQFTTAQMPISLTGTATDAQDGDISAEIMWHSNIDGALGIGSSLSVNLSAGTHLLTARAIDSDFQEAFVTRTITVTSGSSGSGDLVTEGLVLQLESDLNVSTGTGSSVAGWLDQSGLGNDLVAVGNPQLVNSGTPSGQPAIRLDGNDRLERVHATSALGGFPIGNANRTMFIVAKYDSTTSWGGVAYGTANYNRTFGLGVKHPTGELLLQGYGSGNDLVSTTAGVGQGWLVQSGLVSGGSGTLFRNGAQIAKFTHNYATALTRLVIGQEIGGAGYIGMDVAAVLLYDRALSESERASVEAYLTTKYVSGGGPSNAAPTVTITAPANNTSFAAGAPVTFTGTASDPEDGNLSPSLRWSSNQGGEFGTGASVTTSSLAPGPHTITAAVTDAGGLTNSQSVTITINAANSAPSVSITAPANGSSHAAGASITFTGTAADPQDGNVSASLTWSSNVTGALGTGPSVTTSSLPAGTHTITATAQDSGGLTGSQSITITVTGSPGSGDLVTSGLVLRLESDDSVTTGTGSTVTQWGDQSGLGNHVTGHGTPQLMTGAAPTGRPAIRLDGTDFFDRVHASEPLNGFPTANANRTVFIVAKYAGTTSWGGVSYGTGNYNRAFGVGVKHPTGELFLQGYGSGNDLVSTTPGVGQGWMVQSGLLSGGTATLYRNGASVASFSHKYNTILTRLAIGQEIGGAGHIAMDVAAVLVYNRALSEAERAQVNAYLSNKYLSGANAAPTVTITAPAAGASFAAGTAVTFSATASDPEDGTLNPAISWSSNLGGALGTGASVTTSSLAPGTHTITASVNDAGGLSDTDTVTITITSSNQAPTLTITGPANGSTFAAGAPVTFTAAASDPEQGNLSSIIAWTSSVAGPIGTGASITTTTLAAGNHVITAEVTDSGGLKATRTINVTITAPVAPLPVTDGLVLHVESTLGVTTSGGAVTAWQDQSALGNHLSTSGGPVLAAAATPKGQPALRFDGANDYAQRVHSTNPLNGFPTSNGGRTLIVVAKYDSSTWWGGVSYGSASHNRAFGLGVKHPSGEFYLQGYGSSNDLVTTTAGIGSGWSVQVAQVGSGQGRLFKDNTLLAQWSHAYATSLTRFVIGQEIGGAGHVGMDVAAVLLYNRTLSTSEREAVVNHLRQKYLQ